MLDSVFRLIDRVSWLAARLADMAVIALVTAMVYEVVARYVFNAPTEWSYDIAYMGSGSLFILGVSWTLRENAHIRIDIVRKLLPKRIGDLIESGIYLFLLTPLFVMLTHVAVRKTINAWTSGEVEMVSPWAPLMWPYYLILAVGIAALTLQLAAQGLRGFFGLGGLSHSHGSIEGPKP